ncbi:uncharacterized protein LOC106761330 [Vigna radiata var. radiata]|uniref:Uncharacterized protein LOC106761330 n=1 Tax=Vigna radiata var. radiata TaxID=3916 RepID=A0A1S3U2X0_VIGRR|nr:uncharacterized protein LOC106761330 [Vigna radiata var. radiata]
MQNSCSLYEKMGYSNAPRAYYSTLHDSITSLCKTILPLGLKKRCLVSAEHRLWKLQSDNLKWQQDSLHQILNLLALHKDDILSEDEVSAFRAHLLDTLLASPPPEQDHASIIKDKLMFLQELLHAKCISEGEYQSSRRPLLVRLAVQGGEIEGREVINAGLADTKENPEEEWSDIDLKDDQCLMNKENSNSKKTSKQPRKQVMKGATSVLSFGSPFKPGKNSMEKSIFNSPTLHMHSAQSKVSSSSIFTQSELRHPKENKPFRDGSEKMKRKPFRALFHRDKNKKEGHGGGGDHHGLEAEKSAKKQWGFDGLRKGKKSDADDDTVPLSLNERSDSEAYLPSYQHFSRAHGEVSLMNKLQPDESPSVFSVDDKVSEEYVKKKLSRMPTEMRSTNTNLYFSPRCDRQSEEDRHNDAEVKHENSMGWTTFEDEENLHPNLFVNHG